MQIRRLDESSVRELRPLLAEEARHWAAELLWDYADVSAAVASGLERRALSGRLAREDGRPVAYCYSMLDSGRSIVGAMFASTGHRGRGLEEELLEGVIADALGRGGQDRVECQTLFSTARAADECFHRAGFQSRRRHYLVRPLEAAASVPAHSARLRSLRRDDLAAAAEIIHESHRGTHDAALNLTYATTLLCRGFVETLVLRSGCGRFDPEASFIAEAAGGPVGVLLASHLSRTNGHVCQVSVRPEAQGRGVGRLLMASAIEAFRRQGLTSASLSVTVDNRGAYRLYERLGFGVRREFGAHAWVRPPARIELPA